MNLISYEYNLRIMIVRIYNPESYPLLHIFFLSSKTNKGLTVCVSRWWAGWDSLREQGKLEARKILENRAESHQSAARFVRQPARLPERWLKKDTIVKLTTFLHTT